MNPEFNSTVQKQYSGCKHSAVRDSKAAHDTLEIIERGNAADISQGLHLSGHWQAVKQVVTRIPDLQGQLAQIAADVSAGKIDAANQGEYVAYILRISSGIAREGGQVLSPKLIYDVFNKGLGSKDQSFRTSLTACTARAFHELDRARGDRRMAETDAFINQVMQAWKGDLFVTHPSELREWFVRGASYSRLMPSMLPLYGVMLECGCRNEVDLAVFAIEGLASELSDPAARAVPGYVQGLRGWVPHYRERLQRILDGGNTFCSGAALHAPGASSRVTDTQSLADHIHQLLKALR